MALPGAGIARGHVLQKLGRRGPRQAHALQKQREIPRLQSLTLPIDPGHLVEVVQRPHGAPVAQRRANILQVREQHVRGRVSQTRDAQVVGHHAHVGGYGGELLGVHRVVLARIDEHHGVADARRVEGKRRHLGHRRRKIEQHRAAAGTGQLVLSAAGLAEVACHWKKC